jgi:hypothetical protein
MTSLRERITREVLARVRSAVSPVAVLRQPVQAQDRESSPFIALQLESDQSEQRANLLEQRALTLRLVAVSRHADDPWGEADDLLCRAHAALLAEQTLGGLALAVQQQDVDFDADDADAQAVSVPAVYRITYRHLIDNLTTGD